MIALSGHEGVLETDWDSWGQIEQIGSRTTALCVEQRGLGGMGLLGEGYVLRVLSRSLHTH